MTAVCTLVLLERFTLELWNSEPITALTARNHQLASKIATAILHDAGIV